MNQIYGITGRKKHGKDTLAKMVKEIDAEFTILHFADTLKHMSARVFGLTIEQMNDEAAKETPFAEPVDMDTYLPKMMEETGLQLRPQQKVAYTPRQILQYFGAEYVRSVQDSYWIDCLRADIAEAGGKKILIPDYRFPNEAEFLRSIQATLVKVVRTDMPASGDSHTSETSIDGLPTDVVMSVTTGEKGLSSLKQFAQALVSGEIEASIHSTRESAIGLNHIVGTFNFLYQMWEVASGMGANIGVRYVPETGKKEWYVMDVSPDIGKRPEASVLATAGQMMESIANSDLLKKVINEQYGSGPTSPDTHPSA